MDKIKRIKELVVQLNTYRNAYYNNSESQISDYEYDNLFDELKQLEDETGVIMSNSPTQTVGYEVKSKLEKVKHSHPMLSLDKTKDVNDLIAFSNGRDCIVSLKLDGLTILNTYNNSTLIQAETRGNGEEGEIVTHNARVFDNLPSSIPYDRKFEIEGEAIITQSDFEKINANGEYKNSRNLASGSVRQLDSNVTKDRHVRFVAWKIPFGVTAYSIGFDIAARYGFEVVPYEKYNSSKDDIHVIIEKLKTVARDKGYPIDGLVITYDNIEYGKSLGMTGHHPKHSLAFKFYDEEVTTTLRDVEWTMGKTGILTPTAVFEPVEIEGTTVERASLHNISVMKSLYSAQWYEGLQLDVYKANQIIPQVKKAYEPNRICKRRLFIPEKCPICGGKTSIIKENSSEVLVCCNSECKGKLLGKLSHFVSKNATNIDGLSEQTLEKLVELGWLNSFQDIYRLSEHKDEMSKLDGFGKKSVEKLLDAIEKSRSITLDRFIYALCIPLIGRSASKDIAKYCNGDVYILAELVMSGGIDGFMDIDGFGETMFKSLNTWFDIHFDEFVELKREFTFEKVEEKGSGVDLSGKTFVITGSLTHYKNRDELVSVIEQLGGKVSGSVSAKTSYLINNDKQSSSSKNQKAQKLNVSIISEEDFMKMIGE